MVQLSQADGLGTLSSKFRWDIAMFHFYFKVYKTYVLLVSL